MKRHLTELVFSLCMQVRRRSKKLWTTGSMVYVEWPLNKVNGFVRMLRPNGEHAWIHEIALKPFGGRVVSKLHAFAECEGPDIVQTVRGSASRPVGLRSFDRSYVLGLSDEKTMAEGVLRHCRHCGRIVCGSRSPAAGTTRFSFARLARSLLHSSERNAVSW